MEPIRQIIETAGKRARVGDIDGGTRIVQAALTERPGDVDLLEFLGYLSATSRDHELSADVYAQLLARDPGNLAARVNLANALAALNRLPEAAAVADGYDHPKLQRVMAYVRQQGGGDASSALYRQVVAANPTDAESWNNLGNALMAEGALDEALQAFDHAIRIRPEGLPIYFNFSNALFLADRHEARRQLMRQAAEYAPGNAQVFMELGLAEASRGDLELAEAALRRSIALDRGFTRAFVELGLLLENVSRIDSLAALIEEGERRDPDAPELIFLRAWLLRRRGDVGAALALAEQVPENIHPLRRFQLIADLRDRLGDADGAFAAFSQMNEAAIGVQRPLAGPSYIEILQSIRKNLAEPRVEPGPVASQPAAPIFIVGFPRSGTTLLDTLLMNVANVRVLEELPALNEATAVLGQDEAGLATLDDTQANELRARYFERVESLSPEALGHVIIDKHPLHMTRIATIHRLFPDAHVVLVERHPCDAVFSCFMANFQLNTAMRSFTTLEGAAQVYDAAFSIWTEGLARFPGIRATTVRYERMIADLEGELRPLLATLGLPWNDDVLDNRKSAASRERVRTASYAQITEPLYGRAVARWERYRKYLEPVMPILAPWAERMGYPV